MTITVLKLYFNKYECNHRVVPFLRSTWPRFPVLHANPARDQHPPAGHCVRRGAQGLRGVHLRRQQHRPGQQGPGQQRALCEQPESGHSGDGGNGAEGGTPEY
uniref:(northern house mosquito) hypothetical protein n=1 Tax=Culex pipiens TaxID=7175 RepID=A0A8D8E6F1_CULPI